MTWKELSQVLKEKVEAELYSPSGKSNAVTWIELILLLFKERSFFSLRKESGGEVSILKEKSSKKVLDYFFEKAWKRPILKSRSFIV